jgi:hypothetical protein
LLDLCYHRCQDCISKQPTISAESENAMSSATPNSMATPSGDPPGPSVISSGHQYLTHEERLGKAWRNLASSVVSCFHKAEKSASEKERDTFNKTCKELDESVLTFIRARMEWHRLISHVEAKLQGQAEEMEALECYVRTQPRLGKRKRDDPDALKPPLDLESDANNNAG